jgi:Glycogen debranching enzyme, glucanotransferase domain/N-terminal domain from the human glycogen debranching enzyme
MATSEVAFDKPSNHVACEKFDQASSTKTMQPATLTEGSHFDVEPRNARREGSPKKTLLSEIQNARMLGSLSLGGAERGIVRWVTLNYGSCVDCCLFRLQKAWKLRFVIGATLSGMTVRLFTNHPIESGARRMYRELECTEQPSSPGLQFADVEMVSAGSFSYFFTVDGSDREDKARGFGRFIVDPDLRVGRSLKKIPLDGIACQTVLSKNLGPFSGWMSRLMVAKKSGYNAIHFTPIQV